MNIFSFLLGMATSSAELPIRSGLSGSRSPFSGTSSVFCNKLVVPNSPINAGDLGTPPDVYSLRDIVTQVDEKPEKTAENWIRQIIPQRSCQSVFDVLSCEAAMPNPFGNNEYQLFHVKSLIKPDVTVVCLLDGLPVLTIEVLSETYEKTLSKINVS